MMLHSAKKILVIIVLGIFTALITRSFISIWKSTNTITPYRAPIYNDDHPGRVPGYLVMLHRGHSLEAHLAALAPPIDVPIRKVMNLSFIMYFTEVDDQTLDVIRAEPGVKHVECNYIQTGVAETQVSRSTVEP
jgi:hypothetical protein